MIPKAITKPTKLVTIPVPTSLASVETESNLSAPSVLSGSAVKNSAAASFSDKNEPAYVITKPLESAQTSQKFSASTAFPMMPVLKLKTAAAIFKITKPLMPAPAPISTTNKFDDIKPLKVTSIPMKLTVKPEASLKYPSKAVKSDNTLPTSSKVNLKPAAAFLTKPDMKQEASMKLDKKPIMKQEITMKSAMKSASAVPTPLKSSSSTIKSEPYTATTLKQSTAVAAPMKPVTISAEAKRPAYKQMKSTPTSPKSKAEPVIKTTMKINHSKSKSTLVKPAKLQLKSANEATNRKRLCSAEEVLVKKQRAIETRNRKQSEKEAKEIEARNRIIYEKIMFAEKDKVEEILRQEEEKKKLEKARQEALEKTRQGAINEAKKYILSLTQTT